MWFSSIVLSTPRNLVILVLGLTTTSPPHNRLHLRQTKQKMTHQNRAFKVLEAIWCRLGGHKRPIKDFLTYLYVLARDLTCKVQSIKLTSTDFWSPYLVQMGAEIRQSVADVDTDSLLSQNWPPSPLVRHRSCRSCSETESATTDWNGRKKRKKPHGTLRNS